ncbi:MAG: DUF4286 family protein [Lysobacter sp.]
MIYEVNLDLDAAIRDDYVAWLLPHMHEIRALPGFVDAQLFAVDEPAAEDGRVSMSVRYTLHDAASLDVYLREHAPRLRADGEARFGGRFRASRRILRFVDRA